MPCSTPHDIGRFCVCFCPGWIQEHTENRGVRTYVIPTQGMFDWRWVLRVKRLLKDEHVDLIHAHEFDANARDLLAALSGVPLVATVHGKNYFGKTQTATGLSVVSRNATMVAVSENLKQFIVEKVGVDSGHVRVVYNGVDLLLTAALTT